MKLFEIFHVFSIKYKYKIIFNDKIEARNIHIYNNN